MNDHCQAGSPIRIETLTGTSDTNKNDSISPPVSRQVLPLILQMPIYTRLVGIDGTRCSPIRRAMV